MLISNLLLLAQATPGGTPGTAAPPGIGGMLVPFLCIAVIFYFLIIRPQKKKQQDQVKLINSLKTGDKVVTVGGMHGLIANVKETTVLLKIADNVKVEVEKASVERVSKQQAEVAEPAK